MQYTNKNVGKYNFLLKLMNVFLQSISAPNPPNPLALLATCSTVTVSIPCLQTVYILYTVNSLLVHSEEQMKKYYLLK